MRVNLHLGLWLVALIKVVISAMVFEPFLDIIYIYIRIELILIYVDKIDEGFITKYTMLKHVLLNKTS